MDKSTPKVLAIIPARAGSKSVPNKNIRPVSGKPMLAWSIEHALKAESVNRVILSTDSEEYAEIGRKYGAEVPFLRPSEYATDTALDFDVFYHALSWLKEKEGYVPDVVVQLRPTYPIRNPRDIDKMVKLLLSDPSADAVRSVAPAKEVAYKMWHLQEDGCITPIMKDIPECYNMPRQELPMVFYQNACIDVMRAETVLEKHSMTGDRILGYVMDENIDIDTEEELRRAQMLAGGKRFVFDIDGVIAKLHPENNYALSEPNEPMIRAINKLYEAGNTIVLNTARGYVTGIDWTEVTVEQLQRWGLKYHELHFGKPNADYYVDDRMISMNEILKV